MNKTKLKNYVECVRIFNHSKYDIGNGVTNYFYERKCKKLLTVLEKNGVDTEKFVWEQLCGENLGMHYITLFNLMQNGVINKGDLKYVVQLDEFIDGMTEVHPSLQHEYRLRKSIIDSKGDIDVDKLVDKVVSDAQNAPKQDREEYLSQETLKERYMQETTSIIEESDENPNTNPDSGNNDGMGD